MLQSQYLFKVKQKTKNRLNIIFVTILFISLTLSVFNERYINSTFANMVRLISLVTVILFTGSNYIRKYKMVLFFPKEIFKKVTFLFWLLFGASVYLSEIINSQFSSAGLGYIIFVPILFFLIINKSMNDAVLVTFKAISYSQFIIVLYTLLEVPEWNTDYYFGVTNNSNNMGLIAFYAAFSGLITMLYQNKYENFSLLRSLFYSISVIISLATLLQTGSRTPLVALIIGILMYCVYLIISNNIKIRYVISSVVMFVVVYQLFLKELFEKIVLSKFEKSSSAGDLISGRGIIWNKAIEDATVFGHGDGYFENSLGIASHNIFIQVLGEYGLIAMIFFTLFFIMLILLAIKSAFKSQSKLNYVLILIYIFTYLIIGFGESIFGVLVGVPTTALFILVGHLIFSREEEIKKC